MGEVRRRLDRIESLRRQEAIQEGRRIIASMSDDELSLYIHLFVDNAGTPEEQAEVGIPDELMVLACGGDYAVLGADEYVRHILEVLGPWVRPRAERLRLHLTRLRSERANNDPNKNER